MPSMPEAMLSLFLSRSLMKHTPPEGVDRGLWGCSCSMTIDKELLQTHHTEPSVVEGETETLRFLCFTPACAGEAPHLRALFFSSFFFFLASPNSGCDSKFMQTLNLAQCTQGHWQHVTYNFWDFVAFLPNPTCIYRSPGGGICFQQCSHCWISVLTQRAIWGTPSHCSSFLSPTCRLLPDVHTSCSLP